MGTAGGNRFFAMAGGDVADGISCELGVLRGAGGRNCIFGKRFYLCGRSMGALSFWNDTCTADISIYSSHSHIAFMGVFTGKTGASGGLFCAAFVGGDRGFDGGMPESAVDCLFVFSRFDDRIAVFTKNKDAMKESQNLYLGDGDGGKLKEMGKYV